MGSIKGVKQSDKQSGYLTLESFTNQMMIGPQIGLEKYFSLKI